MRNIIIESQRSSYYKTDDIKSISMGAGLMVAPYDAMWYFKCMDADAKFLPLLAKSEVIHRYLPGLKFNDQDSTKKTLAGFLLRTEKGLGFTYFIRMNNVPIGMITVDSPLYNNNPNVLNLNIWTLDFFIAEPFEHKGIMHGALLRVLNQLKGMGIHNVYCVIDASNTSCLNFLISNGLFEEADNFAFKDRNDSQNKPRVFVVDLLTIRFVKD